MIDRKSLVDPDTKTISGKSRISIRDAIIVGSFAVMISGSLLKLAFAQEAIRRDLRMFITQDQAQGWIDAFRDENQNLRVPPIPRRDYSTMLLFTNHSIMASSTQNLKQ